MEIRVTKVVLVAWGEIPEAWTAALDEPDWIARASVLKEDGSSWVRRTRMAGRDVVVKCRTMNTLSRRLKAAVRMGHGAKQWRGTERLMRAGVTAGRPLALMRVEANGQPCEVLVLEHVEGRTLLEVLDQIGREPNREVRWQHRVAREAGATVLKMMQKGCFNRDHKPSNLIVGSAPDGSPTIAVIDAVAVRSADSDRDELERRDMLASMYIEPLGTGCPPRRALWLRTLIAASADQPSFPLSSTRKVLRARLRLVRNAVSSHGDPRPRVDPMAGAASPTARN